MKRLLAVPFLQLLEGGALRFQRLCHLAQLSGDGFQLPGQLLLFVKSLLGVIQAGLRLTMLGDGLLVACHHVLRLPCLMEAGVIDALQPVHFRLRLCKRLLRRMVFLLDPLDRHVIECNGFLGGLTAVIEQRTVQLQLLIPKPLELSLQGGDYLLCVGSGLAALLQCFGELGKALYCGLNAFLQGA